MRHRFAPCIGFVQARLSSESELGLRLTLIFLVLIGAIWLFGGVAEDVVTGDPLTKVDAQISDWFHVHTTPDVIRSMLFITNLHGTIGIGFLSLALALYFCWKKRWYWLLTLMVVLPGGILISVLLKEFFLRDRPNLSDPILILTSYSFPSGHVAGATLFYGVFAAFLASNMRSWRWRAIIILVACVLVLIVGLTRVYLGVHFFSDVVAAAAESTAWLAFCLLAIDALRRRRRKMQRGADA
jgi:membrane-associated phospholipid phosphatase